MVPHCGHWISKFYVFVKATVNSFFLTSWVVDPGLFVATLIGISTAFTLKEMLVLRCQLKLCIIELSFENMYVQVGIKHWVLGR